MQEDRKAYHARRAATQHRLAERSDDSAVARAHRALAALHEARMHANDDARPVLHMVMPG